jgi:hypothetical protein
MQEKDSATNATGYRSPLMRKLAPILVLAAWLIPAATAVAGDNGEGLYGETDDRVITFFSLGVVIFFAVFVIVASWIQAALDRRKQQRKAVDLRKRVGW